MKSVLFPLALIGLVLSWLSGCQTLTSTVVKEPQVNVDHIAVTGVSLDAVDLMLTLKVDNPNNYKLALSGYSYQVSFNDKPMLKGQTDEGFSVAAKQSNLVKVPLRMTFSDVMKLLQEVGADNKLRYDVKADMRLDAPILNAFSLPAEKSGEITVPRLPNIALKDLRVRKLNFSEVDFEIELNIENPNDFSVDLKDLSYQLNMDGEPMAKGALKNDIQLKDQQTTRVLIPVSISLMKLGTRTLNAIRNSSFEGYSLDAQMTIDSEYPALQNLRVPLHFAP